MPEPIISEVIVDEKGPRPVIVEFQNGKLQPGEEKNMNTALFKNALTRETIVAVANDQYLYSGTINRDEDLYNNFLLVQNKKTGIAKLIALDTAVLSPQVRPKKHKLLDVSTSSNPAENGVDGARNKSMSELNKQFGSKRIKRATEQKERLLMDIDAVKEQLEETVAGINITTDDFVSSQPQENDSLYRPPINRDATQLDNVYPLYDLVPESVLESLMQCPDDFMESLELCSFVKDNLSKLSPEDEKTLIFLYVHYLISYILKPAKNLTKKIIVCDTSEAVNQHILENFSAVTNTGRTRPMALRDKAICYIMVLSMIALGYRLDLEMLSKDIKVGVKKLMEMGRILAFTSGKAKNEMILKLPLPAPISMAPRRRKN